MHSNLWLSALVLNVLHTMMLFDCCKNHGGVVRQVFLHLMVCRLLSLIMRKLFFHSGARYKLVTTQLLVLLLSQICTFSRLFLSIGAVFFSNLFIVFF